MKRRIYRFILKPIKKFLREEINYYTGLINEFEEVDRIYDNKTMRTIMDKRAEALYILNWICLKW